MTLQWIIAVGMSLVILSAGVLALRLYLTGEWIGYLDEREQQEGDDYDNAYEDTSVHTAFFPGRLPEGGNHHRGGGSSEGEPGSQSGGGL